MREVDFFDMGLAPYRETWALQGAIQKQIIDQKIALRNGDKVTDRRSDIFLMVEHPHVFTLGKSGDPSHLLRTNAELRRLDAEFVKIDRGGDITYHGPGQIVGYPILDLENYFTDIHRYMRSLEEIMIRVCRDYGIEAGRIDGLTGTWVGKSKICAMGVRCSRWVTMHGFAFNVKTSLNYFDSIVPCGISDKGVTSLEQLLGHPVPMGEVKLKIRHYFEEVFDVHLTELSELPELRDGLEIFKR